MATKARSKGVQWQKQAEEADYPAAQSYLSLLYSPKRAAKLVDALRDAELGKFQAKDIFRASGLPLLDATNSHVKKDLRRIRAGKPLSPLLLVRVPELARLVIADGYHRLCAVYSLNEDAIIPCKIV